MFTIGEKISYPMHGAGVIIGIEEKDILNEKRQYYVLKLAHSDMKVMVPVENSKKIGVRDIIDEEELQDVKKVLESESSSMPKNWNKRSRENMDKLKTGDLCKVAEVVRNLMRNDSKKKLSTGEKRILTTAVELLVSEIVLAKNITADTAEKMIQTCVDCEETE